MITFNLDKVRDGHFYPVSRKLMLGLVAVDNCKHVFSLPDLSLPIPDNEHARVAEDSNRLGREGGFKLPFDKMAVTYKDRLHGQTVLMECHTIDNEFIDFVVNLFVITDAIKDGNPSIGGCSVAALHPSGHYDGFQQLGLTFRFNEYTDQLEVGLHTSRADQTGETIVSDWDGVKEGHELWHQMGLYSHQVCKFLLSLYDREVILRSGGRTHRVSGRRNPLGIREHTIRISSLAVEYLSRPVVCHTPGVIKAAHNRRGHVVRRKNGTTFWRRASQIHGGSDLLQGYETEGPLTSSPL